MLVTLTSFAQTIDEVRQEFHKAVLDPQQSKGFHSYMKNVEKRDPTLQGYEAVSEAMLAQVLWNPFSKLSQVIKYGKQMDAIIDQNPDNIEVRFLRLAIEYNLPPFLGMSAHIEEDIETIKAGIKVSKLDVDSFYKRYIFYFLKQTNLCSTEELVMMEESFDLKSSD